MPFLGSVFGGTICKISLVCPIVFLNRGSDTPTFQMKLRFVRVLVCWSDFSCQGKMPRRRCCVATNKGQWGVIQQAILHLVSCQDYYRLFHMYFSTCKHSEICSLSI